MEQSVLSMICNTTHGTVGGIRRSRFAIE